MKSVFLIRGGVGLLTLLFVVGLMRPAAAQLRIVDYNDSGSNSHSGVGLSGIFKAIGDESRNGIARPLDIISLQEQNLSLASTQNVVNILNSLYGAGTYARSTVAGQGDTTQAVVYNTKTAQLIAQNPFLTTDTSGAARQSLRFQFQPVGYSSSADFYLYSDHYKSDSASSDAARRNVEAQGVRADADALGAGVRAIYTGDFNIYRSSEAMWATLTAAGNGQAIDPINRVGSWTGNSTYADIDTQSPVVNENQSYSGQTGGGMDDRFDWQMVTSPMLSNHGVSMIVSSYHAFGNAGVQFNSNISSSSAAAQLVANFPGYTTANVQTVLDDLQTASDHIPVVADYRLPAKMTVSVGAIPSQVIVGANVSANVSVSNSASAQTSDSADGLVYSVAGTGSVSGSANGTRAALSAPANHSLTLNTSTSGSHIGSIMVNSTSPGVVNGTSSTPVNYTVLEHSNASFSSTSDQNSLNLDLGKFIPNTGQHSINVNLFNLAASDGGPAAGLALLVSSGTGDTPELSASLSSFSDLAAGSSTNILVTLDTSHEGTFDSVYTIVLGDEMLPGTTNDTAMTLTLKGEVIPEPALIAPLLALLIGVLERRRQR